MWYSPAVLSVKTEYLSSTGHRPKPTAFAGPFFSGANRDRTGDLLLAKQALSQLSYGPRGRSLENGRAIKGCADRASEQTVVVPVGLAVLPNGMDGIVGSFRRRKIPIERVIGELCGL